MKGTYLFRRMMPMRREYREIEIIGNHAGTKDAGIDEMSRRTPCYDPIDIRMRVKVAKALQSLAQVENGMLGVFDQEFFHRSLKILEGVPVSIQTRFRDRSRSQAISTFLSLIL